MDYTEVAQFPSSSSSKIYTVKRDENGELSCDCPAWRFKKGTSPGAANTWTKWPPAKRPHRFPSP